jgi:hypothetical protein
LFLLYSKNYKAQQNQNKRNNDKRFYIGQIFFRFISNDTNNSRGSLNKKLNKENKVFEGETNDIELDKNFQILKENVKILSDLGEQHTTQFL